MYWVWRLGMFLTGVAPRRFTLAAATVMGHSAYYLMPLRRRVAKENFAHVLGKSPDNPDVRRVARRSFQNFARHLRDVMIYPSVPIEELEKRITVHHGEYIAEALKLGKGAIIVSAHFGNMDMPSAILAERYAPITLVGETLRPQQLMDFLTRVRQAHKVYLYPYDHAPRKIIEALKRNEMTAFLLDFGITHHFDIPTVPVRFFNTMTNLPIGPVQLALLTGAPIVVGHAQVAQDGHINVHVTSPIIVNQTHDRKTVLQQTMQEIACRMESFIRLYPEQWYIFRPMWKKDGHP